MEPNELLEQIRHQLHIPQAGDAVAPSAQSPRASGEAWHRLRAAIRELEESAGQVGVLPENYPKHLKPVMRAIHALLPWYTRPLQRHAANTVAVARAMEAALEALETRERETDGSGADSPR